MKTEKNKGGRPRTNATPITLRVTPDLLAWIDAERAKLDPAPSRPEMVRKLVVSERALNTGSATKDVLTAIALIQDHLRTEFIVEECRTSPEEGCVSCQAVDLEQRLETLKTWLSD